ncbi:MAG: HlyD family efflux transporter periplasmic adaptor subunit [Planctomycetes bacterium]|nr:HlyD family efflux transporter periplasmic adaptor subunit [Planctomycetota bacterium]
MLFVLVALQSSVASLCAEERPALRIESVVLRPLREAEVPAQQTGLLQQIVVEEGQRVEQGQVLVLLDARQAELAVARAKLEFAQAEAKAQNEISILYAEKALEVAKAELRRSSESIEQFAKSISQSQLDVERLTVEKLTLERRQAEHELVLERFGVQLKQTELEAARLQLSQHQLTAPFAGRVVLVRGRVGEWVEVGSQVLRLVAVDKLRAEGFLSAEQARADLVGKPVILSVADGETVTGTLRFVSPEMEPVTRQVRVWAEIPNAEGGLRPGQQGTLEIKP